MNVSWSGATAMAAICACALLAAAPASATEWLVNATFNDGTALTGTFTVNVYGFLESANLRTQDGLLGAADYTLADSFVASDGVDSPSYIDFQQDYQSDLHVVFANPLTVNSPDDPIVTGGSSFECQGSFSCYLTVVDDTRYIESGFAEEVPEPAIWVLLLTGFAGLGAALRRGRMLASV